MKSALGAIAIVGVAAGIAAATTAACSVDAEHIFASRAFEASLMCLDPYTAIDVVSGGDTGGGCTPVCLENAGEYSISQQCPPYPPLFVIGTLDAGDADPSCTAAFAAFARGDTCDLEGGVIHPDGGDAASADASAADADASAGDAGDAGNATDATIE
jgi:hypothetical protein